MCDLAAKRSRAQRTAERRFENDAAPLTVLQRRDGLAFLAVRAVPDVIGGLDSELVGCEGLQPVRWGLAR